MLLRFFENGCVCDAAVKNEGTVVSLLELFLRVGNSAPR